MARTADWSRVEVEATVSDYLQMLASELARVPYNKAQHRRRLVELLEGRSEQSVEFKHCNISAVLIELEFPYITGYKPRYNYQRLLYDVVAERVGSNRPLLELAAADADSPIVVPEVDDVLQILGDPPSSNDAGARAGEAPARYSGSPVSYLEREARNQSLGSAGEELALEFERARLIELGERRLADKVEHASRTQGDGLGFDILSFETSGQERLIEVKTTKYGKDTPFYVSRNELRVSQERSASYFVYRLFEFRASPRMFMLEGAISSRCTLSPTTYIAYV